MIGVKREARTRANAADVDTQVRRCDAPLSAREARAEEAASAWDEKGAHQWTLMNLTRRGTA